MRNPIIALFVPLLVLAAPASAQSLCATLGIAADCIGDVNQISGGLQISPSSTPGNVTVLGANVSMATLESAVPAGQIFVIGAGTYRQLSIVPKTNQQFIGVGQGQANIKGSRVLTGATLVSGLWQFTGITESGALNGTGNCNAGFRCDHDEDFFLDGVHFQHMTSLGAVVAPGQYFIDYVGHTLSVFDNPTGRTAEMASTTFAFSGTATGVVIKNLTVSQYANPAQTGCVGGDATNVGIGQNWTLENLEVAQCHGAGVALGTNEIARHDYIHHNGQEGLISGCCFIPTRKPLVENSEIAFNNMDGFSSGWEAGAGKFIFTQDMIFRGNLVRGNLGKGPWWDVNNFGCDVGDNTVEDGSDIGIQIEISYRCKVHDNLVRGNCAGISVNGNFGGCGAIAIVNSSDVDVGYNTIDSTIWGQNGIILPETNRGVGLYGPWLTRKVRVHDNDVSQKFRPYWAAGNLASFDFAGALDSRSNQFARNGYHMQNGAATAGVGFGIGSGAASWTTWQADGYDPNGTIDNNFGEGPYNYLCAPQDFENTDCWYQGDTVVTADNAVAPDGTSTADTITLTTGVAGGGAPDFNHHMIAQQFAVRNTQSINNYSASVWVKGTATQQVYVYFWDVALTTPSSTLVTFTGAWQLVTIANFAPGNGTTYVTLSTTGGGGGIVGVTFQAWGYQVNEGTTANLYLAGGLLPAAWDTNYKSPNILVAPDNLTIFQNANSGTNSLVRASRGASVGWRYFEVMANATASSKYCIGIANGLEAIGNYVGATANSIGYCADGTVMLNGASLGNIGAIAGNDIISVAVRPADSKAFFRKNAGNWDTAGRPTPRWPILAALPREFLARAFRSTFSRTEPWVVILAVPILAVQTSGWHLRRLRHPRQVQVR
jgi:hypothetical protein